MSDREDFGITDRGQVVCRGSFVLGTACGHCSRCRDEARQLSQKPTFKVKSGALGEISLRVQPEVLASIKKIAEESGATIGDVVRQMIDFALEHS